MRLRVGNVYAKRETNVVRRILIFAFLDLLKEPYSAIHCHNFYMGVIYTYTHSCLSWLLGEKARQNNRILSFTCACQRTLSKDMCI